MHVRMSQSGRGKRSAHFIASSDVAERRVFAWPAPCTPMMARAAPRCVTTMKGRASFYTTPPAPRRDFNDVVVDLDIDLDIDIAAGVRAASATGMQWDWRGSTSVRGIDLDDATGGRWRTTQRTQPAAIAAIRETVVLGVSDGAHLGCDRERQLLRIALRNENYSQEVVLIGLGTQSKDIHGKSNAKSGSEKYAGG